MGRFLRNFGVVIVSAAVMFLYLVLLYVGVIRENRSFIAISGIVTSLYFCAVVFLVLERPELFHGLITRLGFTLMAGKWSDEDKKRARCLWFLAVAPLFFTFWLALFPARLTLLLCIISALCLLTLLIIGHWQEIPQGFWKAYYHFGKKAFPITIVVVFLIYLPFTVFWNSAGRFVVVKSQQAAKWLSSTLKAEKPADAAPKMMNTVAPSASKPMAAPAAHLMTRKAVRSSLSGATASEVEQRVSVKADDDDLVAAAEAGLTAFDQMRKELGELHAKPPQKKVAAHQIKTPKLAE